MSITASLSHALTGLTASSRAAELVSSNVANAMNEDYSRREIELSARLTGGVGSGVQVDGVVRVVDQLVVRERRLASAQLGSVEASAHFYSSVMKLVGEPDDAGSLVALQARLEASILSANSQPDSEARLATVLSAAEEFAGKLNEIGNGIQQVREDTDAAIAREVDLLNETLQQVADLNAQILRAKNTSSSYPGLLDQRQALVDSISDLIPIRQLERENGAIALYSLGGTLLVDVNPAKLEFESTATITADMTLGTGALSGLRVNGSDISVSGEASPIFGGKLAQLFNIRDHSTVAAQSGVDELARDLISRFEPPGPDPTLAVGEPGFFTDDGMSLDAMNIVGLSSRISVNTLAVPDAGGALFRIRDGLGASVRGPIGDNSILAAYSEVLSEDRTPISGGFSSAARSMGDLTSAFTSQIGQAVSTSHNAMIYSSARFDTLRDEELSQRVDTDQEMQKLLLIEQTYAANARVIQTIDELIDRLIGI